MRKYILYLVLCICFTACQSDHSASKEIASSLEMAEDFQVEPPRTAEPPAPPPAPEESEDDQKIRNSIKKASKIIKDGGMRVEVENLSLAKARIDSTMRQFDAYYENENYQAQTYKSTFYLTLRIPSENFELLLNTIKSGGGKILEKNIEARDVTDQYVDVAIRLNNNKSYLLRYQQLLKKANSVKDILEIQEKIRKIEEEIESRKGRLQYFDDRVRFSTLRIEIFQNIEVTPVKKARNFGQQLVDSFKNGVDGFLDFMLFLVSVWPFVLILGLLLWFRGRIKWRFWRKATVIKN